LSKFKRPIRSSTLTLTRKSTSIRSSLRLFRPDKPFSGSGSGFLNPLCALSSKYSKYEQLVSRVSTISIGWKDSLGSKPRNSGKPISSSPSRDFFQRALGFSYTEPRVSTISRLSKRCEAHVEILCEKIRSSSQPSMRIVRKFGKAMIRTDGRAVRWMWYNFGNAQASGETMALPSPYRLHE
jgi:hypothetical protein